MESLLEEDGPVHRSVSDAESGCVDGSLLFHIRVGSSGVFGGERFIKSEKNHHHRTHITHLGIHPIREQIHDKLHVTLGLHEAAHVGQRGVQLAGVGVREHGWDDSVIRTLVRLEGVWMGRVEGETGTAILEREAAVGGR